MVMFSSAAPTISSKEFAEIKSSIIDRSNLSAIAQAHRVPYTTVRGIYSLKIKEKETKAHATHTKNAKLYWEEFRALILQNSSSNCLIDLSEKYDTQPVLMGKFVLEGLCQSSGQAKVSATEFLQNPNSINLRGTGIPSELLLRELQDCADYDDSYGPLADLTKQNIGREYEAILAQELVGLGMRFHYDGALRAMNLNKTPDFVLLSRAALRGSAVRWLDSKALFGDPDTMRKHYVEQLQPYVNRFGSGVAVYWFGLVAEAAEALRAESGGRVVFAAGFPEDLIVL